jgi:hypothetical protein
MTMMRNGFRRITNSKKSKVLNIHTKSTLKNQKCIHMCLKKSEVEKNPEEIDGKSMIITCLMGVTYSPVALSSDGLLCL